MRANYRLASNAETFAGKRRNFFQFQRLLKVVGNGVVRCGLWLLI